MLKAFDFSKGKSTIDTIEFMMPKVYKAASKNEENIVSNPTRH